MMDFLFAKFVHTCNTENYKLTLIESLGTGQMNFGVWVTYPLSSSWNFREMRAARKRQDATYTTVSFVSQEFWTPISYVAGYTNNNGTKWHENNSFDGNPSESWDKLTTLTKTYERCVYYDEEEEEPENNDNPLIEEINKRYWNNSKVAVVTIQGDWLDKQLLTIYNG